MLPFQQIDLRLYVIPITPLFSERCFSSESQGPVICGCGAARFNGARCGNCALFQQSDVMLSRWLVYDRAITGR